ncbi:AAA family ATPase [Kribbella sp. NPDC026611]|uniref:chloramphenicol phosphotransferase CPT family protein n=1 Tax=Kribbella sp. NPDC026611 TaxID=3154911 RepID=UPI0033ECEF89
MPRTSLPSVIFLNGPSSAGKTTLGRALQDALDVPYLLMGLDTCFATVPAQWAGGPKGAHRAQGFAYVDHPPENGHPVCGISYGPIGLRILQGFHRAVREFVAAGNPVIIDEMMLGPEIRDHWTKTLTNVDVLWIGLHCDLPELEHRETTRKNPPGLSRWSHTRVHQGIPYNLELDTTTHPTKALAHQILTATRL